MTNPNNCPWDCPTCGPCPDPPQFIEDDQGERIGWVCFGCLQGEEYDQADDHERRRPRYRSIDDP